MLTPESVSQVRCGLEAETKIQTNGARQKRDEGEGHPYLPPHPTSFNCEGKQQARTSPLNGTSVKSEVVKLFLA